MSETGEKGMDRRQLLERAAAAGALLAVPGALGGWGPSAFGAAAVAGAAPQRGGRLRAGFVGGGAQETLDPHRALADIDFGRGLNLFERLTEFDPNLGVKNLLAESLEPNPNGTKWQVKLREVDWHNGKPLTPEDVLFSYRRIITKKLIGASRLDPVDIARSKKTGPRTLTLNLKRPFADLPALLAEVWLSIIPAGTTSFAKPIGTGPFRFVSWKQSQRSLFARNEAYWQKGKPYIDELELVSIVDNTARLNALLAGQIDAMVGVDFVQARAQSTNPKIKLVQAQAPFTVPIYVRTDTKPFTDNRVRQALRLAVDRPALVKSVLAGYGTVGNDLFGKGTPYYNTSLPQRAHDPERARSLLKRAGYDSLDLTLYTSTAAPGMEESATAYKEQAKAAGVRIKLVKVPADTYYSGQYYLKVAMGQTNYQGIIPVVWPDALKSNGPFNETAWKRAAWDAGFEKAEATVDPVKRRKIYWDLQEQLWNEGGYIIWGFNNTIDAVSTKVKGVVPSKYYYLGGVAFKNFWLS